MSITPHRLSFPVCIGGKTLTLPFPPPQKKPLKSLKRKHDSQAESVTANVCAEHILQPTTRETNNGSKRIHTRVEGTVHTSKTVPAPPTSVRAKDQLVAPTAHAILRARRTESKSTTQTVKPPIHSAAEPKHVEADVPVGVSVKASDASLKEEPNHALVVAVANMTQMLRDRGYRVLQTNELPTEEEKIALEDGDPTTANDGEGKEEKKGEEEEQKRKGQEKEGKEGKKGKKGKKITEEEEEEKETKEEGGEEETKSRRGTKKLLEPHIVGYACDPKQTRSDIVCVFHDAEKETFGRDMMRRYGEWLRQHRLRHLLVLLTHPVTVQATRDAVVLQDEQAIECEFFLLAELCLSVPRHKLVPHQERVPSHQRLQILKLLRAKAKKLPRMRRSEDPMVKYYNWKVADLIRVRHVSHTGGIYVSYCSVSA